MATLPTTTRISREDVKEAPDWITRILAPINTFFDATYNALNGTLTFGQNIAAQFRTIEFTTSATYSSGDWTTLKFSRSLKSRAVGVLILQITQDEENYTPIEDSVSLDWQEVNGEIQINFVSGLLDQTSYILKVLVI